jgi:hypothetical protein
MVFGLPVLALGDPEPSAIVFARLLAVVPPSVAAVLLLFGAIFGLRTVRDAQSPAVAGFARICYVFCGLLAVAMGYLGIGSFLATRGL